MFKNLFSRHKFEKTPKFKYGDICKYHLPAHPSMIVVIEQARRVYLKKSNEELVLYDVHLEENIYNKINGINETNLNLIATLEEYNESISPIQLHLNSDAKVS